jgi:hypothetical protein
MKLKRNEEHLVVLQSEVNTNALTKYAMLMLNQNMLSASAGSSCSYGQVFVNVRKWPRWQKKKTMLGRAAQMGGRVGCIMPPKQTAVHFYLLD